MKKQLILSLATSAILLGSSLVTVANAQEDVAGHPRVNQVEQRIDNQENRVNSEEQAGKITADQAARDDKRLNNEQNQVVKDEAKNDGHITKAEQKNLNKKLDKNNKIDKKQKRKDKKAAEAGAPATTPAPTTPSN